MILTGLNVVQFFPFACWYKRGVSCDNCWKFRFTDAGHPPRRPCLPLAEHARPDSER